MCWTVHNENLGLYILQRTAGLVNYLSENTITSQQFFVAGTCGLRMAVKMARASRA
jgi:hypothetical protein